MASIVRRKQRQTGNKTPEWIVTFADLMSILVCFFVLIISFSIQDEQKLQVVAGSMREAFGITDEFARGGVIERQGNPARNYMRESSPVEMTRSSQYATVEHDQFETQGPEANTHSDTRAQVETTDRFALAAASLRQAWRMPDITTINDNLILEETPQGLNILIVDQEGRPMFPEGSKYPYESTRRAIAALAPVLERMPNQIHIAGHTAARSQFSDPRYGRWELSFDRANVTRQILEEFGLSPSRVKSVEGRADTEPYFAGDPYLAANQRVQITLLTESPPVPVDLRP